MTPKQVYEVLEKALSNKSEVLLSARHVLGSLIDGMRFQTYILGDDSFQYRGSRYNGARNYSKPQHIVYQCILLASH